MKRHIIIGIILALGIFTFIILNSNVRVNLVESNEFEKIIKDKSVFVLLAHVPYMSEIEGTDLVMEEWENPEKYVGQLPEDKTKPIAVYCRSGRMSRITSKKLIELGYYNVYDLEGGMKEWEESGRKLVNLE